MNLNKYRFHENCFQILSGARNLSVCFVRLLKYVFIFYFFESTHTFLVIKPPVNNFNQSFFLDPKL